MNYRLKYFIGVVAAVLIVTLGVLASLGSEMKGSDERGSDVIRQISPGYSPWFSSPFTPSDEMQSFMFIVQGAIGLAIIGYVVMRLRNERDDIAGTKRGG